MKHFAFGPAGFLCAVVLSGIAGDLLLRAGPFGINVTAICLAVLVIVAIESHRHQLLREPSARVTLGAAFLFSILYSVRDVAPTSLLIIGVLGVSVVLTVSARVGRDPRTAYLWDYAEDAFNFGIWAIRLPFVLMFQTHQAVKTVRGTTSETALAVVRGVLISAPLVIVIGALLISADALFEKVLTDTLDFDLATVLSHLVLGAFCAWIAASVWWQCLEGAVGKPVYGGAPHANVRPRAIEINVALGLVTALFVTFIAVQARYFFGGHERVLTEAGLSYADYARRGFFELATVAGIALVLLLVCARVLEPANPRGKRAFLVVAGVFIASVLVIVASAFHRMSLYIDAYGLTRLRFYTASFMIWSAVVFLWLYFCIHRDRLRRFAWGFLLSGYIATLALVASNPDATIARVNVERAAEGKPLDLDYMRLLSLDAIPPVVRALPDLSESEQRRVREFLDVRAGDFAGRAARTWTLGVTRAAHSLEPLQERTGD